MKATDFIQPGDCLLYKPKGFFGMFIALKTWHNIAHCETYIGKDRDGLHQSVASRDGIGVGLFPIREPQLAWVLRPKEPILMAVAMDKFRRVYQGQGYDFLGLIRFAWREPVSATRFNNKQFCSEFLTRFYRDGGMKDLFNGEDADAVPPYLFLTANQFDKFEVVNGEILEATR
jgi:hypothetical protein